MLTYYANVGKDTDNVDIFFTPTDGDGVSIVGWSDTYIDIFYLDDSGLIVDLMTDQQMNESGSALAYATGELFFYQWNPSTTDFPSYLRTLCIVFKNATGDSSAKRTGIINFNREEAIVTNQEEVETDLTAIGERQTLIRNTIDNAVVPRLKRVLGLLGENMALDQFEYDDAGNIDAMRIRIFEDATSAEASTEDITGALEDGEIVRYSVTQTTDLPKNLRSWHLSSIDTEQDDSTVTENSEVRSDPVAASGNSGTWPSGVNVIG